MAEDNTGLIQQLEQNLAAFEGAGLDEEAKSSKAKLDSLRKAEEPKRAPARPKTSAKKTSAKKGK